MKYHNPTIPGHITAYALEGMPIDDALHRQREAQQAALNKAQENVKADFATAEAKRVELEHAYAETDEPEMEIDTLIAEAKSLLPEQTEKLERAKSEKRAYQQRHGLSYEPATPAVVMNVLSLFVFMTIETGVNAGFLLEAHLAAGPTAALTLSFLISLTNVAVSTWAGFLGRWKEYGRHAPDGGSWAFRRIRLKAQIWFWIYLLIIALFHITVGLVRAHETLESVLAFHTLEGYLAIIGSPHALFLVLTGGVLSGLSYQKGKTAFSDPYPGYSRCQESVQDAHEAIIDLYEDTCEEIEARFEDTEKAALKSRKKLQKKVSRHHKSIEKYRRSCRRLEMAVSHAESRMQSYISLIAGQHRATRGDDTELSLPDLTALSSFQHYLEGIKPPVFYQPPDQHAVSEHRKNLRSRALKDLSTLFEERLTP